MYAGYYKKDVEYGEIKATILVKLDENQQAYVYSYAEKKWVKSGDHDFVWENPDFDKISKEEADKLIK